MFSLIRRDTGFFVLFEQASTTLVDATQAYFDMVNDMPNYTRRLERIRELEHLGDENLRKTLDKLDRTFITPFDRDDIYRFVKRIDDVIDALDAAAKRFQYYRITKSTTWLLKQGELLAKSGRAIGNAVPMLRDMRKPEHLRQALAEVHSLEREADEHHHGAIAELYDTSPDFAAVMKWKEIYDLTEKSIDRCEDIANVMHGIVLKNT